MVTALLVLTGVGAGFLAGSIWEHWRKGGTADLAGRLRYLTRLHTTGDRERAQQLIERGLSR
jgi:hypothetical protein